ncbi:MAG: hypothetical protein ABIH59_02425 [archaeon]
MRLKKVGVFVGILIFIIITIGGVNALKYDCDFRLVSECQTAPWNNILFKISGTSNAHAEINDYNNYSYAICCNFTHLGGEACDPLVNPDNKILGLSSPGNAHVEDPWLDGYTTNICYDGFSCRLTTGDCDSLGYPLKLVSLSATTNAHLEYFNVFPYKLCCNDSLEPAATETCAQQNGNICNSPEVCEGNILSATDTPPGFCCDQLCCTPLSDQEACEAEFGVGYGCGYGVDKGCGLETPGCGSCAEETSCSYSDIPNTPSSCQPDGTECSIEYVTWSQKEAFATEQVTLNVTGNSNCGGKTVSFEIWEDDFLGGDDPANINPHAADLVLDPLSTDTFATTTWAAELQGETFPEEYPPEYYFIAEIITLGKSMSSKNSGPYKLLEVFESNLNCDEIFICDQYLNEISCNNNLCDKDGEIITESSLQRNGQDCGIDECVGATEKWFTNCHCFWDNGACELRSYEMGCEGPDLCGNGLRDAGEVCDSSSSVSPLDGWTCELLGYSGGDLECRADCQGFDESVCIGWDPSNCGGGVVDFGKETCDENNFTRLGGGTWICNNFDEYDEGNIGCTIDCTLDFSDCTSSLVPYPNIGYCDYGQGEVDDCDGDTPGLYISYWSGEYIWGIGNDYGDDLNCGDWGASVCVLDEVYHYDPAGSGASCEAGGETVVECPAEIRLSFFGFYNFIISLITISLVYIILILKRKK